MVAVPQAIMSVAVGDKIVRTFSNKRISEAASREHFGRKYKTTLLFEQIDLDDDGVLMLDLNKAVRVTRGAR